MKKLIKIWPFILSPIVTSFFYFSFDNPSLLVTVGLILHYFQSAYYVFKITNFEKIVLIWLLHRLYKKYIIEEACSGRERQYTCQHYLKYIGYTLNILKNN